MGGSREQGIGVTPTQLSGLTGKSAKLDPGRVHEDKGEVHFHDDKAKKKCAVAVDVAAKAFDRFSSGVRKGDEITMIASDGESAVTITAIEEKSKNENVPAFDVKIRKVGRNVAALTNFFAGN